MTLKKREKYILGRLYNSLTGHYQSSSGLLGQLLLQIQDTFTEDKLRLGMHFFGKNPNLDSESKKGFFVSLVKSKKGL